MSSTTEVKVKIKDEVALRQAVLALQTEGVRVSLLQNARPRGYYENQIGLCDYVLKLEDSRYDVGLVRQLGGSFNIRMDTYQGEIQKVLGARGHEVDYSHAKDGRIAVGKFLQEYARQATINEAANQGFTVESCEVDNDGNLNLILEGM